MGNAYGLVEIVGVVAAMDALDKMCKSAPVELATWERRLGGRLVTLVVEGEVAACEAAVKAAMANPVTKVVSHGIIANPHEEIVKLVEISASRFKNEDWSNFHNKTYL